jgi:hypothetical protein
LEENKKRKAESTSDILLMMILLQQNTKRPEPGQNCHAKKELLFKVCVYLQQNKKGRKPRVQNVTLKL